MAEPIRIGILGAAKIAVTALVAPAKGRSDVVMAAVAARDPARAKAYAEAHGMGRVVADYETLVNDPEIDAVYNALPPSRHADLSIAALEAGKAVLCEKPFTMHAEEARATVAAAERTGGKLMEAFHYRYHPMFARILEVIQAGEIGKVRRIDTAFKINLPETPGELRYDPALGGGALWDLGTYCTHWGRTVAGCEPTVTRANARYSDGGVDVMTEAELDYGNGVTGSLACSMEEPNFAASLVVEGDGGTLTALNPLGPQFGHRLTIRSSEGERHESFTRDTTYSFQLTAFTDWLRGGPAPVTTGRDSIDQMVALDAIAAAARCA